MRRTGVAVAAAVIIAAIAWLSWRPSDSVPTADAPAAALARTGTPDRAAPDTAPAPPPVAAIVDDERAGTLRLEGQVIDADETPVGGAVVTIDTTPRREAVTEQDGSFYFDALIGRPFALVATSDAGTAGPVVARLTASSEPVILRLEPGARATVTVVRASDRRPIADAEVEVRGLVVRTSATGSDGIAPVANVPAGGYEIVARAPGYAPARTYARLAAGETDRIELALRPGAAVSGVVVDDAGAPVAGAAVLFASASDWSAAANPRFDAATSDARGRFRFDALPRGTFRFTARLAPSAPGTSGLVELDGRTERTGVEIRLAPGAAVAGRVVDGAGRAVPNATVRVAVAASSARFERPRETFADDSGAFELTGLPRKALNVVALHETGNSEPVAVDMTDAERRDDLEIVVDVTGAIAGIVVDGEGDPIEGAQVVAFPDVRKGAELSGGAFRLFGLPTELTDAGGRFELRGLRGGPFALAASRPGSDRSDAFLRDPTTARVGDANVRIVLETPGSVRGVVAFADGTAPEAFTVSAGGFGAGKPFSSKDGSFELTDLPPRTYTLTVRGVGFDPVRKTDIAVGPSEAVDVGTITVTEGRAIAGRVVDANGQPVENAKVISGRMLFANGTTATSPARFGPPGRGRVRTAVTDETGTFRLSGVGTGRLNLIAEHDDLGRSTTLGVPASTESVVGVEIALQPFGAIEGLVRINGDPADGFLVNAQSQDATGTMFGVSAGDDGRYRFDRMAPGTYRVSALTGGNPLTGMAFYGKTVTVVAGETTTVDLDVDYGGVTLSVTPTADAGTVNFASVYSVRGDVAAETALALERELAGLPQGLSTFGFSLGGNPAKIDKLRPGSYTLCAVPYPNDVDFRDLGGYIEERGDALPVFCVPHEVAEAPAEQSASVPVRLPDANAPAG